MAGGGDRTRELFQRCLQAKQQLEGSMEGTYGRESISILAEVQNARML